MKIHKALCTLGDEELKARFNPLDMMGKGIYLEIWERDSWEESLEYLMGYAAVGRGFLKQMAEKKVGIVIDLL